MIRRLLVLSALLIAGGPVLAQTVPTALPPAIDPFGEEFQAPAKKTDGPPAPKTVAKGNRSLTTQLMRDYVPLDISVAPAQARRGGIVTVTVTGTSKPYAYTYSAIRRHHTQSGLTPIFDFSSTPWVTPLFPILETGTELKKGKEESSYILHDHFEWKQELYIAPDAPIGKHVVTLKIKMMVCTKEDADAKTNDGCLPPDDYEPLRFTLEITKDTPLPPPDDLEARKSAKPPTIEGQYTTLGGLLFGSFLGAILMLLTPCVFPMIPITVNFFIKQAEREHHRPFLTASVYAGTIVVLLTVVILLVGKSIIDLANDAWFNLGLGLVLIVFALGLFGMIEVDLTKFFGTILLLGVAYGLSTGAKRIFPALSAGNYEFALAVLSLILAVPTTIGLALLLRRLEGLFGFEESAILSFLAKQESRGGMLGAAFMAMTFTITSFSCTGPFLGLLLAPLAGSSFTPLHLLMAALVYSLTFAAPFFLLALFPTYLKKLPKSGGWMTTIKVTMGFLEIGAALKFLANADLFWFPGAPILFNYDTVLCSWIALSFACSIYLFGFFRLHHDTPSDHIGVPRMIFACLFLGMAIYLTPLLFGGSPRGIVMEAAVSFLPPELRKHGAIDWIEDDYKTAWEEAVREQKLIFIDFTGQNCANCRANERNAFTNPGVIRELKKYVGLQLFTDAVPNPELTPAQSKELGLKQREWQIGMAKTIANPVYVIFEPDRTQPFDENGAPKGRVVAQTSGLIQNVRQFQKFLENP